MRPMVNSRVGGSPPLGPRAVALRCRPAPRAFRTLWEDRSRPAACDGQPQAPLVVGVLSLDIPMEKVGERGERKAACPFSLFRNLVK